MRAKGRRWLWIVGLPLFLGVAAHWGFHFYVAHALDRLSLQLPAGSAFRYGGLRTSLLGEVDVEDVHLRLPTLPAPLELPRVELRGPSLASYLLHNNPFVGYGPPRFLSLRVPRLQTALKVSAASGDGCDLENGIPPRLLIALGMHKLTGDLNLGYRYRPDTATLQGRLQLVLQQMEQFDLELRLQNVTSRGFRRGELATALLGEFKARVNVEPAFGQRLIDHCASRRRLTPAAFGRQLARAVLVKLQSKGVVLTDALVETVRDYMERWGSLELDLTPPVPISVALLPFVPPQQLQKKLGVELAVNGRVVPDLRLDLARTAAPATSAGKKEPAAAPRLVLVEKRWLYQPVAPSQLRRYLGHKARLQERGDPVRSGVLVEVDEGQAVLRQRIRGGEFLAYLSLDDLVRSEVYVSRPVPQGR